MDFLAAIVMKKTHREHLVANNATRSIAFGRWGEIIFRREAQMRPVHRLMRAYEAGMHLYSKLGRDVLPTS